jgi:hypothetical protein
MVTNVLSLEQENEEWVYFFFSGGNETGFLDGYPCL